MVKRYPGGPLGLVMQLLSIPERKAGFMFKYVMLFLAFLLLGTKANAQDLIVKQDKTNIEAKVVEITDDAVKYHRSDNPDGPVYNVKKAEVFMIIYKNGRTESFSAPENAAAPVPTPTPVPAPQTKPANTPPVRNESLISTDPKAEVVADARKVIKNKSRIMLGFGGYKQSGYSEKALKGGYEKVYSNPRLISGIGIASNNFVDMFWIYYQGYTEASGGGQIPDGSGSSYIETVYGSKHYLSGYAFREFDTKFISFGVLAGPGLNYTRGTYSLYDGVQKTYPVSDVEGGFFTVGLHTGLYLHKYLSTNKKGERNLFMRLGFEQFVMAKGSFGSVLSLSFGI